MTRRRLPKKIGPYEIDRRLASGGWVRFVLASNSLLERRTALKRVLPDSDDGDTEEARKTPSSAFLREGQLLARLPPPGDLRGLRHHPVPGAYWMALEYAMATTSARC